MVNRGLAGHKKRRPRGAARREGADFSCLALTSAVLVDHLALLYCQPVGRGHARDISHWPGNGRLAMLLVVDAGNTNIVFAVHDPSGWRGVWRIRTDAQRTSDEYAVWLNSLLTLSDLKRDQIDNAVLVVGANDAEPAGPVAMHRQDRHRDAGAAGAVRLDQLAEIDAI